LAPVITKILRKTSRKRQQIQEASKEIELSFIFPFAFDPFVHHFWIFKPSLISPILLWCLPDGAYHLL
jgi:hypothetical protein